MRAAESANGYPLWFYIHMMGACYLAQEYIKPDACQTHGMSPLDPMLRFYEWSLQY